MTLVWVTKHLTFKLVWATFKEAYAHFKLCNVEFAEEERAILIYPKLMSRKKYQELKEFGGI